MTRIMLFSYSYARHIINNRKNAAASLANSMAMQIRQYGAERIAQYGRSRATLDTTEHHNRASICLVLSQRMPWSSVLV